MSFKRCCSALSILFLSACGGGGGGEMQAIQSEQNNTTNKAPINVSLKTITIITDSVVTVEWDQARDENTAASQLLYELHLSDTEQFIASSSNLVFSGKNTLSVQLTDLKPMTTYFFKLKVTDTNGLSSFSISKKITIPKSIPIKVVPLNDTGIVNCIDDRYLFTQCTKSNVASYLQDGQIGRDQQASKGQLKKDGDGDFGFDFTKIGSNGEKLPADASKWDCVLDNHTGLMWEVKSNDYGYRDKRKKYAWYNPKIGGAISNGENTYAYVQEVNKNGLCGYSDWYLPTVEELISIINYGKYPVLDTKYFPDITDGILAYDYNWSSSPYITDNYNAWMVSFATGAYFMDFLVVHHHIRLVRINK